MPRCARGSCRRWSFPGWFPGERFPSRRLASPARWRKRTGARRRTPRRTRNVKAKGSEGVVARKQCAERVPPEDLAAVGALEPRPYSLPAEAPTDVGDLGTVPLLPAAASLPDRL